jgi:agmatinase
MKLKKVDLSFQSCNAEYKEAKVVIFSSPMDATCSFRPGTRFAGNAIRVDSFGVEWYSPYQDLDLKDYKTCDIGDLDLPIGQVEHSLKLIEETTAKILADGKKPMMIGGEHLCSLAPVKALIKQYPDLRIIHFDAHTDLRDEFFGRKLSHATVLRRIYDLVGDDKIWQFGIRSGDKSEWNWAEKEKHTHLHRYDLETLDECLEKIKDYPVYFTLDLDVLDPAYFPGTGTPEPGGVTFKELLAAILKLKKLKNFVGADMMELSPQYDTSGASTAAACKALREIVLLLHQERGHE